MSRQPARHAVAAPRTAAVAVGFSQAISAASAGNLRVHGGQRQGRRAGTVAGGGTSTLTFAPTQAFAPGEAVSVSVPATLASPGGTAVSRQTYQFWAATGGGGRGFFGDTTRFGFTSTRDQQLGDLDGDGDLDLITTGGLFGCRTYLNDGTGSFTFKINLLTGTTPCGTALADVDNDGDLDLLAGDATDNTVTVCLNDGAANFSDLLLGTPRLAVGQRPVSVAAGDLDADGDLDFATANVNAGTATVWFNAGTTYTTSATVSVGGLPTAVALADVDNDGDLDLVTSHYGASSSAPGEVHVCRNNGSGGFGLYTSVGVGVQPSELVLTDLDLDGDLDLLTANEGASLSVCLNGGTGTFGSATTLALPAGSTPTGLRAGDVDADGDPDVVVAQGAGGRVFTFLNTGGSLTLQARPLRLSRDASASALGVTLGDVDGDLDLDLITANENGRLVLARNLGSLPALPAPTITSLTPTAGPIGSSVTIGGTNLTEVTAVAFNGTAAPGFVLNGQGTGLTVSVPAGASTGPVMVTTDEAGTATSPQPFTVTTAVLVTGVVPARNARNQLRTRSVTATFGAAITAASAGNLRVLGSQRKGRWPGTVSGGGTSTLTFAPAQPYGAGEVLIVSVPTLLQASDGRAVSGLVSQFTVATGGTGQGNLAAETLLSLSSTLSYAVLGDVDADGNLDVVGLSSGGLYRLPGNGQGGFGAPVALGSGTTFGLALGDLDADGDLDVVSIGYSGLVSTWLNNGSGTFAAGPASSTNGARQPQLADFDADGDLDLVLLDTYTAQVYFNNGAGSFGNVVTLVLPAPSRDLAIQATAVGDVDNDGDLDLLITGSDLSYGVSALSVQLNDGKGAFVASSRVTTLTDNKRLALGDLDNDGDLDVAVQYTEAGLGRTGVLLNDGTGTFGAVVSKLARPDTGPALADVDADGDLDVVLAGGVGLNDGTGNLAWVGFPNGSVYPSALLVGDVDNDLDVDLLAPRDSYLGVRLNQALPAPTITAFSPGTGAAGTQVRVLGTGFLGARSVTFGGVAAQVVQVRSATEVLATVPAGATTGSLTLTTTAGTATSATVFEVTQALAVTGRSPARQARAPRNSSVTVTFAQPISAATADNLRVFGNQRRGQRPGTVSGGGTNALTFTPAQAFAPGEAVSVSLPASLRGTATGTAVVPQTYQFGAAVGGTGNGTFLSLGTADIPLAFRASSVVAGDLDNDDDLDLVSSDGTVHINNGAGGFTPASTSRLSLGDEARSLTLADVNGDGRLDLLTPAGRLLLNVGGTLTPAANFAPESSVSRDVVVGDFDGDGDLDAAVPRYNIDSLYVTFNNGAGTFGERLPVAVGVRPVALAAGDLDADGDLDLVVACEGYYNPLGNSSRLTVLLNNGSGQFVRGADLPAGDYLARVLLGDLDGDGDLDLVTDLGQLRFNNGSGQFGSPSSLMLAGAPTIAMGDVDADGDLDLLLSASPAIIAFNNGQGQFRGTAGPDFDIANGLALADIDGDGDLDALAVPAINSAVQVRLNYSVAPPIISSFSPAGGLPGALVTITGTDFVTTSSVKFNGVAASFVLNSPTQLTATTPAGLTTGPISVTNLRGTATSATVFVAYQPVAVATLSPGRNAVAARTAPVQVTFSQPIAANSTATLAAYSAVRGGRLAGTRTGAGTTTLSLAPTRPYVAGEQVRVSLPAYASGTSQVRKQVYQFRAAVGGTGRGYLGAATFSEVGSGGFSVVPGDINNDGKLDVVLRRQTTIEVLLGDGNGNLTGTGAPPLAVPFTPYGQLVLGDLDGDGDLDLAVVRDSSKVALRFNDGTGTFSGRDNVTVGPGPSSLALADMDADGDLDIVTANQSSAGSTTSVRFNDGTGHFSGTTNALLSTNTVNYFFSALQVGDVDADGDLDLLVGSSNAVVTQLNDGLGNLTTRTTSFTTAGNAGLESLADLDGDGDLDLLTLSSPAFAGQTATARVGFNDGTGAFTASSFALPGDASGLAVGDLDADGDLDLLVQIYGALSGELWVNNGQGSFARLMALALGTTPTACTLADVDDDGDLDVLHGNQYQTVLNVRLNGPQPPPVIVSFSPGSGIEGTSVTVTGTGLLGVTAVAFNGTAAPGFVVNSPTQLTVAVPVGATTGLITVASATGTGSSPTAFTVIPQVSATSFSPTRHAVAAPRPGPVAVTFAAPISAASAGNLRVFGNQLRGRRPGTMAGGGTSTLSFAPTQPFAPGEQVSVTLPGSLASTSGSAVRRQVYQFTAATGGPGGGQFRFGPRLATGRYTGDVVLADIDNDGDLDLAMPSASTDGLGNWTYALELRLNNGTGQYGSTIAFGISTYELGTQLLAGDLDGDGDLDLVLSGNYGSVWMLPNNGSAAFGTLRRLGAQANRFALGDVDADGDLDLVGTHAQPNLLTVSLNDGTGTLTQQLGGQPSPGGRNVQLSDVDNDGDLDAVTTNDSNGALLYLNNGSGSFGPGTSLPATGTCQSLAVGDLDGDGDPDLAIGSADATWTNQRVALLLNNGSGQFSSQPALPTGNLNVDQVRLADVDHDGDLDLVVSATGGVTQLLVWPNGGTGNFARVYPAALQTYAYNMAVGDVDGDGDLDLATNQTSTGTSYTDLYLNDGQLLGTTAARAGIQLAAYPNPAREQCTVVVPATQRPTSTDAAPARLYDALGRVVREVPLRLSAAGELLVPVQELPAGLYTLRLELTGGPASCVVAVE